MSTENNTANITAAVNRNLTLLDPVPEYFGHKIRVLVDELNENAPWFVAADLSKALGLIKQKTAYYAGRLDANDKGVHSIDTLGGKQKMLIVSEAGFYEFVFGSRKREAVAFKRWVCSSVLPSIRKYGQYKAYDDEEGANADVPEVMVEMVNLTSRLPNGHTTETAQRMHLREWIEKNGLEGMNRKYRAAFGKICRRFMLNNDLPILTRWTSSKAYRGHKSAYVQKVGYAGRVYPEAIIEMAYAEYLKGRRD